ncbi:Biotin biosynthesis cytochrome P450 [compost metagenome]
MRYEPVATFKVRQAAKDVEIRGVAIPQGAMVSCIVTSANRDEDAFENADTFDIDRRAKPSFGFGFGPHMCIGQFVAKTEINCALNAILDLMPRTSASIRTSRLRRSSGHSCAVLITCT